MNLPASPLRRRLLKASLYAICLPLVGCTPSPMLGGSFVQLWRSHLEWTREKWQRQLAATHAFGCREIFLQWVGIDGAPEKTWRAPDSLLQLILDECGSRGIGVHFGLPYDERWWNAIGATDETALAVFLRDTGNRGCEYMQRARWTSHEAFRGWYIPYELEQHSWGTPARMDRLAGWLNAFSEAAIASSGHEPAISTYFSALPSTSTLSTMWRVLLDRVKLRPMIQDGVGVAGIENYRNLQALHDMLVERHAKFDLILELFEQLPPKQADGTDFNARSASFRRIEAQWDIARGYGAQRIVAFAVDPWVLGDTPEARALRQRWQAALGGTLPA
ncbi:DUF4434 domain-containing protein [Burkholderia sp. MR1-5-21]